MNKQTIIIDKSAIKELNRLPLIIREEFYSSFNKLGIKGQLELPFGKKLTKDLFEIRIRHKNHWRTLYSYLPNKIIIILTIFKKTTEKTPLKEIKKTKKRLSYYVKTNI